MIAGLPESVRLLDAPGAAAIPGVPYSLLFEVVDKFGNVVDDPSLAVTVTYKESTTEATAGTLANPVVDEEGTTSDQWSAALMLPATAGYTLTFAIGGVENLQVLSATGEDVTTGLELFATSHSWLKLYTKDDGANAPPTTRRFEHTSFVHGKDLYVWGGAAADKSYLGSLERLTNADGFAGGNTLYYMKAIKLSSPAAFEKKTVVEIEVEGVGVLRNPLQ